MRREVLFLTAAGLLAVRDARADDARELKKDVPVDVAITGAVVGLVVESELGKRDLAPSACRWCASNALDDGARDALRWKSPRTAAHISDVMGFVVAPGAAFGTLAGAAAGDDALGKTPTDALIVLETVSANALLNQIVKYTVARERPFSRHAAAPSPTPDARLSFYSGHTSMSFSLAAAAGTVAHLRDYRLAPIAWIPGAAVAAFTGYLRIAADKHYLSDVLVGAMVGTAIGVLLPVVFHPRAEGASPAAPAEAASPVTMQVLSLGGAF